MAVTFEGMERRMPKIEKCLAEYGIANLEEARKICNDLGFDPYDIVKGVQRSHLKTQAGLTHSVVQLQLRRAQRLLQRQQKLSVSVLRLSVFPAQ